MRAMKLPTHKSTGWRKKIIAYQDLPTPFGVFLSSYLFPHFKFVFPYQGVSPTDTFAFSLDLLLTTIYLAKKNIDFLQDMFLFQ